MKLKPISSADAGSDEQPAVIAEAGEFRSQDTNPRTAARRARTRARLLQAARVVFERDGFHNARLSDIVDEAHVAVGTFYNYYTSKAEIFRSLMSLVVADLARTAHVEDGHSSEPVAGIEAANRSYVRGYRRNARLMSLLLQVAENDEEVAALGREIRNKFEERIGRAIKQWQRDGLAWPDLDPIYAANALAFMVDRFLYEWTIMDNDYDEDKVVNTLTKLWARGLGLEQPTMPE